jgi:hypothetical protein
MKNYVKNLEVREVREMRVLETREGQGVHGDERKNGSLRS